MFKTEYTTPSRRTRLWSDQLIEDAVMMWNDGRTSAEIASAIGKDRGAICGKMYRLRKEGYIDAKGRPVKDKASMSDIPSKERSRIAARARRKRFDEKRRAAGGQAKGGPKPWVKKEDVKKKLAEIAAFSESDIISDVTDKDHVCGPDPGPTPKSPASIIDLERNECRWPYETEQGRRWCGRPTAEHSQSYCMHHDIRQVHTRECVMRIKRLVRLER